MGGFTAFALWAGGVAALWLLFWIAHKLDHICSILLWQARQQGMKD